MYEYKGYIFKQVFEISVALVKEQVINQGKKSIDDFFSCVTLQGSMRTHQRPLISVTDHHEKHKDSLTP